jgi:hypothetical protein
VGWPPVLDAEFIRLCKTLRFDFQVSASPCTHT